MTLDDSLAAGLAALQAGRWEDARAAFEAALKEEPESADALAGVGEALLWLNELEGALRSTERAHAGFRRRGDLCQAARAAMWLGRQHFLIHGNASAANGWMVRAERLLQGSAPCVERGWIEIFRRAGSGDPEVVQHAAARATEVARQFNDNDLEAVALAYSGIGLVASGHLAEGMDRLDAAMAAATAGEVRGLSAITEIFCVVLTACERAGDVQRAEDWCRIADDFARRHCRHPNPFAATCRTIYGAVLTATGRWPEAETVLVGALRTFENGHRAMRVDALVRLANLRLLQGRLEEARLFIEGYEDHPEAARVVAALALEQDQPTIATAVLQRRLRQLGSETLQIVPLLRLLVAAQLAQGDVAAARGTADRLTDLANRSRSRGISAVAELAAARISEAAREEPVPHLEAALNLFLQVDMPLELAQTRLALAQALAAREPLVAAAEARAALAAFESLGAMRDADAAAHLLRQLGVGGRAGPRGVGVLSQRQQEVLELLGLGLSNDQIASRLYISRRTAEHHVGAILAKLGLVTRIQAAVYAVRHGSKNS